MEQLWKHCGVCIHQENIKKWVLNKLSGTVELDVHGRTSSLIQRWVAAFNYSKV